MRRSILDAALEVFAEAGYRSGSVREIAERVGITDAGVLHHFGSKSGLLSAVLDRRDELVAPLVPEGEAAGMDTLRGLIDVARFIPTQPGVAELHCTLLAEATAPTHPAHDWFVDRYDRTRGNLVRAFEVAQSLGRLAPGVDTVLAAASTLALLDGLQLQWLLNRDAIDMAATLRAHFERLVDLRP